MRSLTYGQLPDRSEFMAATADHFPYPMELVGQSAMVAIDAVNQGIDSHLEAVDAHGFRPRYAHKAGVQIESPESMHTFLRRLTERWERDDSPDGEEAGDLASCILETLGYEWV